MEVKTMTKASPKPVAADSKTNIRVLLNSVMDSSGYRKRFDELLGKNTPTFVANLTSLITSSPQLQTCFVANPATVIQAALTATSYDLPIGPGLGYAYILPFKDKATLVLGYKGLIQLCERSGAYKRINVISIKRGELKSRDPLREDFEFEWIEDQEAREKAETVGYAAFFRMVNGMEKIVYMSKAEIDAHEKKFRKGPYRPKMWEDNYDAMAQKTVLRQLLGKWGLMSIQYNMSKAGSMVTSDITGGNDDDADADFITTEFTEGVE